MPTGKECPTCPKRKYCEATTSIWPCHTVGIKSESKATESPAPSGQAESALLAGVVGEVLFDGYAVLQEIKRHDELSVRTPNQVSDVLDAVVRLIKSKTS